MEVRSSRRVRTLVTQMARSGLSANEIAPALIPMMARSETLQSKAGYIDARPLPLYRRNSLATHGRTIHWVRCGCSHDRRDSPLSIEKQPKVARLDTSHPLGRKSSPVLAGEAFVKAGNGRHCPLTLRSCRICLPDPAIGLGCPLRIVDAERYKQSVSGFWCLEPPCETWRPRPCAPWLRDRRSTRASPTPSRPNGEGP